jgi:hypothetical protein
MGGAELLPFGLLILPEEARRNALGLGAWDVSGEDTRLVARNPWKVNHLGRNLLNPLGRKGPLLDLSAGQQGHLFPQATRWFDCTC